MPAGLDTGGAGWGEVMVATSIDALLRAGVDAARGGDRARAVDLFRQATDLEPDNEAIWLWRAKCAEAPPEVADCLTEAARLNPDNASTRAALPDALVRAALAVRDDRPRAVAYLTEATTLAPRHELAWLWRAGMADAPEESLRHLQTVLAINPANEKARAGAAQLQKQLAVKWHCPLCDHPDEAVQKLCPRCGCVVTLEEPSAFDRSRAIDKPRIQERAKALHTAMGVKPTAAGVFALGLAYLNLGYVEEGIRALQSAARQPAADPAWRRQLARLVQHREETVRKAATVVKPLILVVDDSPTVRKLVAGTLTTAGYRVAEAESGYAAADLIRTQGVPALFLLDVNMPGMDGFTLCKSLRSSPETAKVPVVFLTGKDGFISKLRGQWAGASDYLTKPFDPPRLLATVSKLAPTGQPG